MNDTNAIQLISCFDANSSVNTEGLSVPRHTMLHNFEVLIGLSRSTLVSTNVYALQYSQRLLYYAQQDSALSTSPFNKLYMNVDKCDTIYSQSVMLNQML